MQKGYAKSRRPTERRNSTAAHLYLPYLTFIKKYENVVIDEVYENRAKGETRAAGLNTSKKLNNHLSLSIQTYSLPKKP